MKTLLVLAQHPDFAEAIRAAVNPDSFRIIHRVSLDEAEPLLHAALFGGCIIDAEDGAHWVWMIEKIRRRIPNCPIIVYTGAKAWEWEEEAYLMGVAHVVAKPVRARLLNALLERSVARPPANTQRPLAAPTPAPAGRLQESGAGALATPSNAFHALEFSRHFSAILTHSLNAEAMLKKFLLLLREMVGVNRAAIFLQEPAALFSKPAGADAVRRGLKKGCAIGLPSGLLEHFELSFETGIGAHLYRSGKILRRGTEEAIADEDIRREFEILGAEVAVPVLDREALVGVAVFDGRLTGEPLLNTELEMIFHLLEELALAVKNIWMHDQLAANHEMMADIFRQLHSACVIVGQDLSILHANKTARGYFSKGGLRGTELEFSDLPPALGGKIFQVLKTGTAIGSFRFTPDDATDSVYSVSIVPFQKAGSALPVSALLMAEDLTQTEQLHKLEVEAANLRLVTTMADRLAHEIGNALVPLSTHQQLLKERYKDPEFRATLETAMADSVKRVTRLINQMRFLARDSAASPESFAMEGLIEDAYLEAQKHQTVKVPKLDYKNGTEPIIVRGDRAALKHAFSEVILNALQANPTDPKIGVRVHADGNGAGTTGVQVEIQDNGAGFTTEAAKKVPTPFHTTRNVGLGLGLTVSRKIIETHHGKLEILPTKSGGTGLVRITLPIGPDKETN